MFEWAGSPQTLGGSNRKRGEKERCMGSCYRKKAREETQGKIKANTGDERRNFVAVVEEEIRKETDASPSVDGEYSRRTDVPSEKWREHIDKFHRDHPFPCQSLHATKLQS